jgi:hypothetical protein
MGEVRYERARHDEQSHEGDDHRVSSMLVVPREAFDQQAVHPELHLHVRFAALARGAEGEVDFIGAHPEPVRGGMAEWNNFGQVAD